MSLGLDYVGAVQQQYQLHLLPSEHGSAIEWRVKERRYNTAAAWTPPVLRKTLNVPVSHSFEDLSSVLLGTSELNGPGPDGAVRELTPSILQTCGLSGPDRTWWDLTADQM